MKGQRGEKRVAKNGICEIECSWWMEWSGVEWRMGFKKTEDMNARQRLEEVRE